MDKMQATDVRRDWRKMLDRAEHEHKLTAITRHGEVVAVLVPADYTSRSS